MSEFENCELECGAVGNYCRCRDEKARESECPTGAGCSMAGREAERKLVEIYERQAVEATMFLMTRLNRGQIKMIREVDPKLADFFFECLRH